jgi:hypothetical protein
MAKLPNILISEVSKPQPNRGEATIDPRLRVVFRGKICVITLTLLRGPKLNSVVRSNVVGVRVGVGGHCSNDERDLKC